ncbi:MAG: hypothetical protein ABI267_08775 [Ginsengibacter sp.]
MDSAFEKDNSLIQDGVKIEIRLISLFTILSEKYDKAKLRTR